MKVDGIGPRPDVEALLSQMRTLKVAAHAQVAPLQDTNGGAVGALSSTSTGAVRFTDHLKHALDSVSRIQSEAGVLANEFSRGVHNDLVSVMVASQKANVAFQAVTQVRNRLVSAYEEIMRMPI